MKKPKLCFCRWTPLHTSPTKNRQSCLPSRSLSVYSLCVQGEPYEIGSREWEVEPRTATAKKFSLSLLIIVSCYMYSSNNKLQMYCRRTFAVLYFCIIINNILKIAWNNDGKGLPNSLLQQSKVLSICIH